MKAELIEAEEIKTSYNLLKEDYHALQLQFESSERLRYRQKSLIKLLQQNSQSNESYPIDLSLNITTDIFNKDKTGVIYQ